jgi:DNA-binding transcriptional regulator YiaG
MANKYKELRAKMRPQAQQASAEEFRRIIDEMPLRKLRAARELTQANLATVLHVNQSEVSKIESRTDMYVSTLASYIKAMGGDLEIRAVFPDGAAVRITQFEELASS